MVQTLLTRTAARSIQVSQILHAAAAYRGSTAPRQSAPRRRRSVTIYPSPMPLSADTVAPAADSAAFSRPTGFLGAIYTVVAFFLEEGINAWVHLTGKRIRRGDQSWLDAPLGEKGRIGTAIYDRIAQAENLQSRIPPAAGLIPDFNALRGPTFDPSALHPAIRHFYEHAAQYHLDVWTEVSLTGRFFLWLLVEFISRRMDQLNFPISSLEVSRGMSSQIVQLIDPQTSTIKYTGWLRR